MADMTIDDATADTQITGVEKLPASDGGTAKSVTVGQIRDFVVAELADADAADDVDVAEDGIFVSVDGEVKTLPAEKLAKAVINYACALTGIVSPNGNEIFIIDDSGTKKTITLAQITSYITSNADGFFSSLSSAGTMAASDKVIVKQGGSAKEGTLGNLAAFALSTFASFIGGCVNVLNVQDTDKVVVVSGGVTKWMTVAQFSSALATGMSVPDATTSGNIPTWGNSTGSALGAGYAVSTSIRSQGTADNNTIPTEAAVRAALGNGNVTGPTSTTENKIPQWDHATKALKDGLTLATTVATPGVDTKVPTEKAVRTAIGAAVNGLGSGDVTGPTTTTENLVPQWDSTQKKLKNGLGVVTSVGGTGADTNIPTEKAVRSAITAATSSLGSGDVQKSGTPSTGSLAKWNAAGKIEGGPTVTSTVGGTGVDTAVPTEKAVRTAITNATSDAIAKSGTPTSGKLAKFASASTVMDGPGVTTSVGSTGADTAVPTEKAVRDAINAAKAEAIATASADATTKANAAQAAASATVDDKVSAPSSHAENDIPTWGAANELKAGKSVVTVLASNGSNDNIPTEKAVRDALPVPATNAVDGLMSSDDKAKLDGMPDLGAVAEINAALDDTDVIIVKDNDTTWKKALITRLWTWLMGKLSTFRIDDLAVGEDNSDLNATTARHGLCPKLSGNTDQFLCGDGSFAVPSGSSDFTGDSGSGGAHGLVPAPASGDALANKFLNASGQWAVPPSAAGVDIPGAQTVGSAAAADMLYCFDDSENAYRKVSLSQIAAFVMGVHRYDNIFIPAGAMVPSAANGATPGALTFTNVKRDTLAFSNTTGQGAEFSVVMPEDWDGGTVRAKLMWTAYDATKAEQGEMVAWKIGAVSTPDEGAITVAPANYATVTDNLSQVNELHRTGATGQITAEGTRGAGNLVHFVVKRDPTAETANPMDTEALLLGVWLQYGRTSSVTEEWS